MKIKTTIILLLLILNSNNLQGMGFGDWAAYTKHSTYFYSPGGGTTITLTNRKEYRSPKKWYFYKAHIIGKGKTNIDGRFKANFFVINEKEGDIHVFEKKAAWETYIHSNDLSPKYWQRWYTENWNHIELILLLAIFMFPISIPILLLNVYFYYKLAKSEKERKKWTILAAITPAIIFFINILGKFPESL